MLDMLKTFLPRAVQDILTGLASVLFAHGFLPDAASEEKFIGSTFFLSMLVINYFITQSRKGKAAIAGAASTGILLTPDVVSTAIAAGKGKTP